MKYIIALDAGTTSIRAFLYDIAANAFVYRASRETESSYPHPGWVEQNAEEIYSKALSALGDCARVAEGEVACVAITNQRETVVAFDENGAPLAPAIVWQCRRTSEFCEKIPQKDKEFIRARTGLLPDAYFSASKMGWIMENCPAAQVAYRRGKLRFGTIDSYLIYRFTEGRSFVTDHTNASRTMLFDTASLTWDGELCSYFGVPQDALPAALPSDARMGEMTLCGRRVPIVGVLGDQQAALFGQACHTAGDGKITYGTGLFLLFATDRRVIPKSGLLSTIACTVNGETRYALEGSVFHAGSTVQWLRDEMGLIGSAEETERLATRVPDTGGVCFVPALTGLGAPYWDPDARGLLSGISRGTRKEHVVRAVLESIAYSARDVVDCMERDSGIRLRSVKCDGGASSNDFLMGFQADVLGIPVDRPVERESTALGAAHLAAVAIGARSLSELPRLRKSDKVFPPAQNREYFNNLYAAYRNAVSLALRKP